MTLSQGCGSLLLTGTAFKNTELLPSTSVGVGRGHFKSFQANLTNTGIKNHDRRDREPLKVTWSDPCLTRVRWRVEGGGRGKAEGPGQELQQWTTPQWERGGTLQSHQGNRTDGMWGVHIAGKKETQGENPVLGMRT